MGTQEEPIEEQVQEEQQELEPEDTETLLQRVQEAEARAARMEAEFQRQRDEDFRRKLESAPPEERMQLELEFERSKRQEAEMRLVRNEIRQEYPLFTGMLEIFGQHFQMEFDSAEELRAIAQAMGPELSRLFSDSITTEKGKVRKEAVKKWGIQKHGEMKPDSKLQQWLTWATRQADRLDPLAE